MPNYLNTCFILLVISGYEIRGVKPRGGANDNLKLTFEKSAFKRDNIIV